MTPNDLIGEVSAAINGSKAGSIKLQGEDRDIKVLYDTFNDIVSPSDIEDLQVTTKVGPIVL